MVRVGRTCKEGSLEHSRARNNVPRLPKGSVLLEGARDRLEATVGTASPPPREKCGVEPRDLALVHCMEDKCYAKADAVVVSFRHALHMLKTRSVLLPSCYPPH